MTREDELAEARDWLLHFNAVSRAHGLDPVPLTESNIAWTAMLNALCPTQPEEAALSQQQSS